VHTVFIRKPGRRRPVRDLGLHGRIILRWNLRKQGVRIWTGLIWPEAALEITE
jgi:hypothetical protein